MSLADKLRTMNLADDPLGLSARERMQELLRTQPDCFKRSCFDPGHFTGSALLLSADRQKALLTHHRFLNCWLQLGGHCDGNPDVAAAALREAEEESGIPGLKLISDIPVNLDIHRIPANPKKGEPPHLHFDVHYLVQAPENAVHQITEESIDLRWFTPEEALAVDNDSGLTRLIQRWQEMI